MTKFYYFTEEAYYEGNVVKLSLKCSPPLTSDIIKLMLVCCRLDFPSKGLDLEIPVLNERVQDLIRIIDTEKTKKLLYESFEFLINDAKSNYRTHKLSDPL